MKIPVWVRGGEVLGAVLLLVPKHVGLVALEHQGVDFGVMNGDGGVGFSCFSGGVVHLRIEGLGSRIMGQAVSASRRGCGGDGRWGCGRRKPGGMVKSLTDIFAGGHRTVGRLDVINGAVVAGDGLPPRENPVRRRVIVRRGQRVSARSLAGSGGNRVAAP